tara:strand:+ start:109 stop:606 length:498 start_codon:yes stop_codon:yes gene_type:complete
MKKLLLTAFIVCAPFMTKFASAAGGHGPAGCGLGTEVIFTNADEWHEHVLAATTNGSASQTFAMTSGTLGCEDANGPLKIDVAIFLDNNMEQLAAETATGQGETLAALSELIGVDAADSATFNSALKANFDQIFSSEEVTSGQAYDALVSVMKQDIVLSKYVNQA